MSNVRGDVFSRGVGFIVGHGREASFLPDDRVGMGPSRYMFSRVFRVVSNKVFVWDCCTGRSLR